MKPDERGFEDAIADSLVAAGGYRLCKWGTKPEWVADFDRFRGLDTAVVARIDQDSAQLADALTGEQSRIVITTLQKFPFILGTWFGSWSVPG